jgi:hypothetical protein
MATRKKKQYQGEPAGKSVTTLSTVKAPFTRETGDGKKDGPIWLSRLAKTMRLREEMRNGSKDWKRYYLWFEGEQWMERGMDSHTLASDNARNTATVNITGSIALSYMPFLINGQIKFKLKPRKEEETTSADIQQGLLNYEWGERGMTEECKAIVHDVTVIGHGIGKTGYVVEVDEARRKSQGEIEYRDYIKKDAAYLERVDPLLFLKDLGAKDGTLKTARWVAECSFDSYDDVMANTNYNREALQLIHTGAYTLAMRAGFEGASSNDPVWGQKLSQTVPEDNLVAKWEIYDKKFRKRYIYAEGVPIPLLEEEWPYPYLDGFPYTQIDFIKVNNRPYGMGVMRLAEDQQIQLNRIRTAQFLHIRSHNRKFIGINGAFDKDEATKFTDLPDGALIMAERPDAIAPIPDAPMSPDFERVEGRIASDTTQLTGADDLLQGKALPSRTTGVEITARTSIQRLKADDRVSAVEGGVTELARQVLHHLKANRTLPDVVRIVGAEGAKWREYEPDDIQADVDVEVQYFSAPKFDPALDRQQWLQILQVIVQAMPALAESGSPVQVDLPAVLGAVLKRFDEPEVARFFRPALQPTQTFEQPEGQTTPALGGMSAPSEVPQEPGGEMSPEVADLLMQLTGGGVGGAGALPTV